MTASLGNVLYALSLDRKSVFMFEADDNGSGSWSTIGGPADRVYAGDGGVVATQPGTGNLFGFTGSGTSWRLIGTAGDNFVFTSQGLFGRNPGGVFRYTGRNTTWEQVGGPAREIYGGRFGLVATSPRSGELQRFPGGTDFTWPTIGGPGAAFVEGGDELYGLTPNRQKVVWFLGTPWQWKTVGVGATDGGPYAALYGGHAGLLAASACGDVYFFGGDPTWSRIGGPGLMFAVADTDVYAITPGHDVVRFHNGIWKDLGKKAVWIAAGYRSAF